MTTASWSTVLDHTSDAGFRAWGSELSGKFSAVGMVQTADSGQINWTTVTRPGASTAAGYEIWKLSSGNLYFKIEYGTGSNTSAPQFWLTVGTGSDGSGSLTGQTSTRTAVSSGNLTVLSTSTPYQSYLCATANYFGLSWKIGSAVAGVARLFLTCMQTVDNTGAANSVGYFWAGNSSSSTNTTQMVATTAGVTGSAITGASGVPFFIPGNSSATPATSSDGSGNNQAFVWFSQILGTTPMAPLLHAATVLKSDLAVGSTASMTLVGSTSHTYLSATQRVLGDASATIAAASLCDIMLYE